LKEECNVGQKVLVADDSGTMRRIIIRSFNALGINEVTEAEDGEVALAKFSAAPFDIVITDWNMPRKTGLEVIQGIRGQGSSVPIIMVTTESEKRNVLAAITAGVSDYLVKPFDTEQLREKLLKFVAI
jgi:two-component system chemotaxis response regulator CheY